MSVRAQRLARSQRTNVALGLLLVAGTIFAVYYAFARPDPFADPFVVRAVMTSAEGVRPGLTPVRVAGVEVGRVSEVSSFRGSRSSVLTIELNDEAPQIRADATMKLRPRLFLEGNSFVDLRPGTPNGARIDSGHTIPMRQTSVYVPLPHVLGALTADTRAHLQSLLQEYGGALVEEGTDTSLNEATRQAAKALPNVAVVSRAATGDGALDTAIRDFGRVAETLDETGPRLPQFLHSLRGASAAFARESAAVTATFEALPGALIRSRTALRATTAALPSARRLSAATAHALPAVPAALHAGVPWLGQLKALLGPDELGADLASLVPATDELAGGARPFTGLLAQVDRLSGCSTRVLIPTANAKIDDGDRTSGATAWQEFLSAAVGAAGAAQNLDGNGALLRGQPGGGSTAVATQPARFLGLPLYGNAIAPPLGTRPALPKGKPMHSTRTPCAKGKAPDLNAAPIGPADGAAR